MTETVIQNVKFDERGLIPAIVQDARTREVMALSYLDNARLAKTLQTGQTTFLTDTETALNNQPYRLIDVRVSGDGASLIVLVERENGSASKRFSSSLLEEKQKTQAEVSLVDVASMEFGLTVHNLYSLIADRNENRPEGSYTTYLFNSGLDKILKKIAEESGEVIIAAKNEAPREIISELADLFYHLLVLMVERDVKLSDVRDELMRRATPKKQ
ncbi:MAG TPA: phosphoribosyl-ATP diphosphatase [Blastocatellia bacterium]|nr:phosphoribosyl-ATP diphosphatase [Blastocatellia bacterium]